MKAWILEGLTNLEIAELLHIDYDNVAQLVQTYRLSVPDRQHIIQRRRGASTAAPDSPGAMRKRAEKAHARLQEIMRDARYTDNARMDFWPTSEWVMSWCHVDAPKKVRLEK